MNRFARRPFSLAALTLALGLPLASIATAQNDDLNGPPPWELADPQAAPESSAEEPATVAERLFAATLDRFPSALENEQAAQQIDDGQMDSLIGTLLGSSEYRRQRASLTPNSLLDQYFEGLLDRAPDQADYRRFSPELSRGNDGGVLRALLESDEFDEATAGPTLEAGPLETACMEAVEQRVSSDLERTTKLRFLTVATSKQSFIAKETRGTAKLPDGREIEFVCASERLTDSIVDVAYQVTGEPEQQPVIVRCESFDQRRECPADTRGGVALVRQLGTITCRESVNWGYNEKGIWVDRGCRGEFRTMAGTAKRTLELAGEGSGFLEQPGSSVVWFTGAQLDCEPGGAAKLAFTGRNTAAVSGTCYELDEGHIQLTLAGTSGDWFTEGGASVTVAGGSLDTVRVAGRSRFGEPFTIAFRASTPPVVVGSTENGDGFLEGADGRQVPATSVRIEPESDGRVTFHFEGQARFSFTGSWFQTWSGDYEVILDGGLNDASTRGAGTIRWSEDGSSTIELAGTASSAGGSFHLIFKGRASR